MVRPAKFSVVIELAKVTVVSLKRQVESAWQLCDVTNRRSEGDVAAARVSEHGVVRADVEGIRLSAVQARSCVGTSLDGADC